VRVDVNGVGIEVEVAGEGQPVVLLHGFPDSGRLGRHRRHCRGFSVSRVFGLYIGDSEVSRPGLEPEI
jgi:pimeloyl-ACP methyl ester carboxylesterase